jgi:glycosyltransferase involved in cell wall biosynthesis
MEKIKFGIVISTYKRKDGKTPFYLNRTLESIFKQTYQNFKVFLIGDRYEDDDEFNLYGQQFDTNKIYKVNRMFAEERDVYTDKMILWKYGGCSSFNHGIDVAINEGIDYIIKLDHDDWFEPTHLENFKKCIDETNADFMCSKSTHIHGVLPGIKSDKKFVEFLPGSMGLVKSSHCMNYKTIPLRSRNLYKETNVSQLPGDADLWNRIRTHIEENNLKSYMINEITCHHDTEGYIKRGGS